MLGFKSFRSARATFGRNRALAYAEEGPKQEFSAGLGAILCTGHCEIVASDETSSSGFPSVRDRTDLAVVQIKVESVWPAECYLSIAALGVIRKKGKIYRRARRCPEEFAEVDGLFSPPIPFQLPGREHH